MVFTLLYFKSIPIFRDAFLICALLANARKEGYLKGTIVYVGPFDNFHRFPQMLKQENFQEIPTQDNPTLKLFYNDSLDVDVEMKTSSSRKLLAKMLLSTVSMRLRELPLAGKREPATLKKH